MNAPKRGGYRGGKPGDEMRPPVTTDRGTPAHNPALYPHTSAAIGDTRWCPVCAPPSVSAEPNTRTSPSPAETTANNSKDLPVAPGPSPSPPERLPTLEEEPRNIMDDLAPVEPMGPLPKPDRPSSILNVRPPAPSPDGERPTGWRHEQENPTHRPEPATGYRFTESGLSKSRCMTCGEVIAHDVERSWTVAGLKAAVNAAMADEPGTGGEITAHQARIVLQVLERWKP